MNRQANIGPYALERELGRGGFGIVYLAHDPKLERAVAIKVLPEEFSGDKQRLSRFRREARLLASLNHPNIATIYSLGETDDGLHYIVLELLEGVSLEQRLRDGPMSIKEAINTCGQIAEALEAAHRKDVIHRDLKPGNVMFTADGRVKVLDFGLARTEAGPAVAGVAEDRTASLGASAIGTILGSPGYMSPEQARGMPVDRRSDIFSFGCVLYECLTGVRAFGAETVADALALVLTRDPDYSLMPDGTPDDVLALVQRCLEKDASLRPASIREARLEIEAATREPQLTATTIRLAALRPPNNLPAQLTSFIGREREIDEIKALPATARLITLTGAGGCGKTRLALKIAEEVIEEYPDGVWRVELAPLSDAGQVGPATATTLGLREEPGKSLLESIIEHLRPKNVLLILDNCEHLLGACGDLADALLKACPELRVLATSREGLGIVGETTWRVPSLSLPPPVRDQIEAIEPELMHQIGESEAVRLFVERAGVAKHGFDLTDSNASAIARICSRLDGIPLAIELAAARVKVLSVEQIHGKLGDRFRLLTGGSRTSLERHQTLRAAIEWSYGLLSEEEKYVLCALSVFTGGRTLESATAVCGHDFDEFQMLDHLTRLIDKSLVVVEEESASVRYRLLESIRQYGLVKLDDLGEAKATRDRHLEFFIDLAEAAEKEIRGPDQAAWLAQLEAEHENLLAALAWCDAIDDGAEKGLRLAGSLWRFWETRGHYATGRSAIEEALSRGAVKERTEARAKALAGAGGLAWGLADYTQASAYHQESLEIHREHGNKTGIAASLNNLGAVAYQLGDYAEARSKYEESLAIKREQGDKQGVARSLNNLGLVTYEQGDYDTARSLYEESLAIKRELGDKRGIAASLDNEGMVAFEQGDYEAARALHEEALAIEKELGDKWGIAASLHNLGDVALEQEKLDEARDLFTASLAIHRELDDGGGVAGSLHNLGIVECRRGEFETARPLLEEGLKIRNGLGDKSGIASSLEAIAANAFEHNMIEKTALLFGAAGKLREEIGSPLPQSERRHFEACIAKAKEVIGQEALSKALSEGSGLAMQDAVQIAFDCLKETDPG